MEGADEPPIAGGLTTVIFAAPMAEMSVAVMDARRLELDTNVVGRALPFQSTMEVGKKFVPEMVTVNAAPPTTAELGVIIMMLGGGI
jgi:hypothetical protein